MIGPGRAIGKPANIALHLSYDRRCAHCVPVPEHRNDLCRRGYCQDALALQQGRSKGLHYSYVCGSTLLTWVS